MKVSFSPLIKARKSREAGGSRSQNLLVVGPVLSERIDLEVEMASCLLPMATSAPESTSACYLHAHLFAEEDPWSLAAEVVGNPFLFVQC